MVTSLYFDLMVSNIHTARVSIRSLSAPNIWAYELWETSSSPVVRGTVEWAGKPDLGLVALVLNDYATTRATPCRPRDNL